MTLWERYGTRLSEGAIDAIRHRAGAKAAPLAEAIKAQVLQPDAVVRSDETSARVQGKNWWQWVFRSDAGQYYTIVPTRSTAEIEQVLGELLVYTGKAMVRVINGDDSVSAGEIEIASIAPSLFTADSFRERMACGSGIARER